MEFENKLPVWENEGIAPSENLRKNGFVGGYKPPASTFNFFWSTVSKAITELQTSVSDAADTKSVRVDISLLATGWTDASYTLNDSNILKETQPIEMLPAATITAEQLEMLQAANIVGISQAVGSVTIKAYGDVPTADIPVTLIIRGDL